jgi:SnoaL-like domain
MTLFSNNQSATPPPASTRVNNRRSFLQKLGIGVSTALGSAAVIGNTDNSRVPGDLALQVSTLEAQQALRSLHQQYEHAMAQGCADPAQQDAVLALFAEDAEVVFNGGVFSGREQGISRLYRHHFATGNTGKPMPPAPGFALPVQLEKVEVTQDLRTAKAEFPYSIQVSKPLDSTTSLASMAKLHGEGVHSWWESGTYALAYVRDVKENRWRIQRLAYNTLARADYRTGRSYAKPIRVTAFTARFPEDAQGPDRLV